MKFEAPSEADMEVEKALSPSDRYLNNDETKPAAAAVSEGESEGDDLVRLSNLLVNIHLIGTHITNELLTFVMLTMFNSFQRPIKR
jgi:hypothetical protein